MDPHARELALAELQHAAVERGGRNVERVGRQRLAVELTPPWASLRRASEREPPNTVAITSGRCSVPPLAATTASAISSGIWCEMNTRSKPASASVAASAPQNRSTSARASARLASRGPTSAGNLARRAAGRTTTPSSSSGIRSVLPYISPGGSVIPIWLPNDFDILRVPSSPFSSGIVSTIWGFWPCVVWSARPMCRLNVWSVPPISTSAVTATES